MTLTESQRALLQWFYTIATDPDVKAAGWSPARFKDAVFAKFKNDFFVVSAFVLKTGVAPKVSQATGNVARTVLGGTVSQKASDELAAGMETLVKDGLHWLGDTLGKKTEPKK